MEDDRKHLEQSELAGGTQQNTQFWLYSCSCQFACRHTAQKRQLRAQRLKLLNGNFSASLSWVVDTNGMTPWGSVSRGGEFHDGNKIDSFGFWMWVISLISGMPLAIPSLENDSLRKRYEGLKYDVKKVKEVVCHLSIRGCNREPAAACVQQGAPRRPC
ncbi:hypothetical protein JEQ12_009298 [Ovis aries]|uniref:Uncharacterized protein n=1 Tax=Ovis aries TaxID=9940 RepID=A0A836ACX3_SHEEP|nr:hypothetical protein JEQ12_009298 [Ovis aries]